MDELLTFLVKALVDDENAVEIKKTETENSLEFNVKVAENDIGKVIGKNGRTASSLRNIMRAMAAKEHKRVFVKFED